MQRRYIVLVIVLLVTAACSATQQAATTPVPTAAPIAAAATIAPSPEPTPSSTPLPPTATPTATLTATPIPPTSTPDPVAGLTIPDLRAKNYGEGAITIGEEWARGTGYITYRISYPVDGLRLTGLLHVPNGAGPFPVIIANRGTIDRERYQPGMDSRAFSDLAARNGFVVVAPDFRGYAGGDDGPNPFYTGFYADVLGLIPLAQKLPMAQPGKIGMWGHSRGASVTIAALTVSDQIAAAVAYAPAPADLAADYERRFRNSGGNPSSDTWVFTPADDPESYRRVSPINYFDAVSAPVQLHHGTADTTVSDNASIAIADALRAAGKQATLYLYEGSGHAFEGSAYNQYAERTLAFFREHLL